MRFQAEGGARCRLAGKVSWRRQGLRVALVVVRPHRGMEDAEEAAFNDGGPGPRWPSMGL